jgi:hypothetical protein
MNFINVFYFLIAEKKAEETKYKKIVKRLAHMEVLSSKLHYSFIFIFVFYPFTQWSGSVTFYMNTNNKRLKINNYFTFD